MGYLNQPLQSTRIFTFSGDRTFRYFFVKHDIPLSVRDKTYKRRSFCIDTVSVTYNFSSFCYFIKLLNISEVINTYQTPFPLQINAALYFSLDINKSTKPLYMQLNHLIFSQRNKFKSKAYELLHTLDLETIVDRLEDKYSLE